MHQSDWMNKGKGWNKYGRREKFAGWGGFM